MPNPSLNQARDRSDLSQFLIHLTKNGNFQSYYPSSSGGYLYRRVSVRAKSSLDQMLSTRKIEARSPFGYFKLKISFPKQSRGPVAPDWIKSVCFSETPLQELKNFYTAVTSKRNAYQKYGLAFWADNLIGKGANPIFYTDSRKSSYLNALNQMLGPQIQQFVPVLHLYETFGPLVLGGQGYSDFRWEREWRKRGDLKFQDTDVAFGLCPANEIDHYEALVNRAYPFLDPDWDEATIRAYLNKFGANRLLAAL